MTSPSVSVKKDDAEDPEDAPGEELGPVDPSPGDHLGEPVGAKRVSGAIDNKVGAQGQISKSIQQP
jgi:hypothetical protein